MTPGMQQLLAGGGAQTLSFTPDERVDTTPAPTWVLEDLHEDQDSDDRVIEQGNATVDTTTVPLTHEVGPRLPSPRTLRIPGGSLEPERAYLLEDGEGVAERVFVASVGTGGAELFTPVRGYFPANSTVRGLQLSAEIPEPVAADPDLLDDETALLLTWEFHVRGQLRRVTELGRVVRGDGTGRYNVAVEREIAIAWPELAAQLEREVTTFPRMIRYAERRLMARVRAHSTDPEAFMAGPQGLDLLVVRTLLHFAQQGLHPTSRDPEEFVAERKAEYVQMWTDLFTGQPGRDVVERGPENTVKASHSKRRRNPFVRA